MILSISYLTPIFDCFISFAKSSINIANKVGDKASPCFTPEGVANQSVRYSLTCTQEIGMSHQSLSLTNYRLKDPYFQNQKLSEYCADQEHIIYSGSGFTKTILFFQQHVLILQKGY